MDTIKTRLHELSIIELPISNPASELSDIIPPRIKVWWKHYVASKSIPYFRIGFLDSIFKGDLDYQEIIPETRGHGSWILGAQPDEGIIKKINKEYGRQVHIVSMLVNRERVIKSENSEIFKKQNANPPIATISRRPWFDHTVVDITTGKNQIIGTDADKNSSSLKGFNQELYKYFVSKPSQTFYCHCMAGRSRSFTETLAFLFQYPDIFDFSENGWSSILKQIKLKKGFECLEDLKYRLSNVPSISDIAEFVELLRPHVKPLRKLDGDQAGLLGLIALAKAAGGISEERIKNKNRLYKDAQDIGLMLRAPLDNVFRDFDDRKEQEKNLGKAFKIFQTQGINLLATMIVPSDIFLSGQKFDEDIFKRYFDKLKPGEQARFAILLQQLEKLKFAGEDIDLEFLACKSIEYAKTSIKNVEELTAGDQVELLHIFGDVLFLNKSDAATFCSIAAKKVHDNFIKRLIRTFNLKK